MATAYSYNTTGVPQTTVFQASASSGSMISTPVSTTLTIVPVTLSASSTTVLAGQPVTLSFSGPNNNSTSWMLNVSGSNPVPLAPACNGNTCAGTYDTGPLGNTTTFSVSIQGPGPTGGQAYSPNVIVTVEQPTTFGIHGAAASRAPGGCHAVMDNQERVLHQHRSGRRAGAAGGHGFVLLCPSHDDDHLHRSRHVGISRCASGGGNRYRDGEYGRNL